MILNTATSIYGNPSESTIHYFNGTANTLEIENFDLFWNFLCYLENNRSKKEILDWSAENNVSSIDSIISDLMNENILTETPVAANSYEQRYINFFSAYKNGKSIMNRLANLKIMIIGTGTIGATLALSLAKMNIKNLILIDTDNVEPHNINAQFAYTLHDVGVKKTISLLQKLRQFTKEDNFSYYDMFINDSNIQTLLNIIETERPEIVFSCFDNASYNIHNSIYQKLKSINAHYILNGYFNDSIISIVLDTDTTKDKVLSSYHAFNDEHIFPANRGIITQSLSGALINCSRILEFANSGTLKDNYISFDLQKLELSKTDSASFCSVDKAISFLKNSYDLESVEELIADLSRKELPKETQNYFANKIAELRNVLAILNQLGESSYTEAEDILEQYVSDKDDDIFSEMEDTYAEYDYIVDNIFLNGHHIFKVLSTINYEPSYEKRVQIQKDIFEEIKKHSAALLPIMKKLKMFHYYHSSFLQEEKGISGDILNLFFDSVKENLWKLADPLYKEIFPDKKFDYLFDIHDDLQIKMNFSDSVSFIQNLFNDQLNLSLLHFDIYYHVKNMLANQFILDIKGKKTYDTHYLPSINKNIIIFDHLETMYSVLLLAHEIGHSYFSQFYGKNFYDTANIIINETLAHFFEIIFIHALLTSPNYNDSFKKGAKLQYFYRINQTVISSLSSEKLEERVMQHLLKNNDISLTDFLELNTPAFQEENIILENQKNSRLNILLFPPFMTSYKEFSAEAFSYMLAISLFEIHKNDFNSLLAKLEKTLKNPELTLDLFVKELYNQSMTTDFFLTLQEQFTQHTTAFRKESDDER